MDVFNFLTGYSRQVQYRSILVAPVNMRQRFMEMIDVEITNALRGKPARLIAKMNGLEDPVLVRKLYEASQAGVSIDLIVRGNCRIRPGLPGISDNIRVLSIIGRFLEHSRIWYFENGGEPRYFFGSADWMRRNLSNRVEVVTPIEDPRLQEQLWQILQTSLDDHRQGWDMLPDGRYRHRCPPPGDEFSNAALGVQVTLMRHARQISAQLPIIED
jgi:polyphosphate kinase